MADALSLDEIEARITGEVPIGRAPIRRKPTVELIEGDCRKALADFAANSIDSVVTDPPYALVSIQKRFGKPGSAPAKDVYARGATGFMGKQWDTGETAFDPAFWVEVMRVLKPGGHVLAFGGTRTYHRLACAIEDAGFEIRDQIGWLYGSGFPKSHNQNGDWQGWGTALKPAWEPIVVARKALDGTNAANLAKWGVGALNIDGCRVPSDDSTRRSNTAEMGYHGGNLATSYQTGSDAGRWPANVIHDGSDEVIEAFPAAPGQIADESRTAPSAKTSRVYGAMKRQGEPSQDDPNEGAVGFKMKPGARRLDSGSAARFFYCAKASRADRDAGLASFDTKVVDVLAGHRSRRMEEVKRPDGAEPAVGKNTHPTVKPTPLMRYLCRLVTPPGGTVLDPFMGSGSTGRGAVLEGFNFIGCEMEAEYMDIADARIAAAETEFMR